MLIAIGGVGILHAMPFPARPGSGQRCLAISLSSRRGLTFALFTVFGKTVTPRHSGDHGEHVRYVAGRSRCSR